jgi:hypothetical protein
MNISQHKNKMFISKDYCGGQCSSRVTKIVLLRGDVILWVTNKYCDLDKYIDKIVRGDVNSSLVSVPHEIHEHWFPTNNDDSMVCI